MKMEVEGFMVVLLLLYWAILNAAVECPINFDYVAQWSWNTSSCQSIQTTEELNNCGMALRSMLGVGLAQYLRDESAFELPDNASAAACLIRFQQKLTFLGLRPNLVQLCFNDTSEFVSNPSLCAGIQTKKDWIHKVGITSLDTVCKGDLSSISACRMCHDSGEVVHRQLLSKIKNATEEISTQCYYFACLYAIGVVNEFGPMDRGAAGCILRMPFMHTKPTSHRQIALYGCMGAVIGIFVICSLGICYYWWVKIKNRAKHRHWVEMSRGLLKLNTGAVWFSLEEIAAATDNFSLANVIGEGGFGTVYRGTLSDGQQIAVKRIRNCTSEGDSEFINELTDRSDVYSFGVVLLEIMSGRKALDTSVECTSDYLITDWAWKLVKVGKTIEIVDVGIRDKGPVDIMERFVLVGILCAHVMVAFRPSMVEALKMLEGEADIPEIPDRPLPLLNQGALEDGYSNSVLFSNSESL
ncbi:hypothetical protein SUGI_0476580 [Cryptomeria japonica]|nr:hypothetical protein SUGI_0476580 [Cryptomeria japonica]